MSINRHNYEEFFILYMDNELSSEQRREVEQFVQANADLKEELDMLQQSKLIMDDTIIFDDKELLLKPAGHIDLTNYEEWLLLYTDNELDAEQKRAVERFAASHPSVSEELNILQKSRLQPETIIFPDKASLYRKEERTRSVVMMRWTRIAVAAVLLFAVSIGGFVFINRNNEGTAGPANGGVARLDESKNNKLNQTPPVTNRNNGVNVTGRETAASKNEQNPSHVIREEAQPRQTGASTQFAVNRSNTVRNAQDEETINTDEPSAETAVYQPRNIQSNIKDDGITKPEASYASLRNLQQNKPVIAVTPIDLDALDLQTPDDGLNYANTSERKNSKLRGFFRKVTRTIEKTTNIKTTDDDDRLLVAGLAIRL